MSAETLSDSELRTKLLEYGYPVGPVTLTTRKILIKKLKNLMETKGGSGSRHSMAARFSSDDTDDDSSAAAKKKKKAPLNNRRQTLANPMPPPVSTVPIAAPSVTKSPSKKRLTRNLPVADPPVTDELPAIPSINFRNSPTIAKPERSNATKNNRSSKEKDDLETGSDSDAVEEIPKKAPVSSKINTATPKGQNDRTTGLTAADVNSPKPFDANWRRHLRENEESSLRATLAAKNEKYGVHLPKSNLPSSSSNTNIKDIRIKHLPSNLKPDDILNNYETPYLSEFTRRLSVQASLNSPTLSKGSLKASKYRYSTYGVTNEETESDSNGHFRHSTRPILPVSSMPYVTSSLDKSNRIRTEQNKSQTATIKENKNWPLIGAFLLVFVVLGILYFRLEEKSEYPLLPADSDIPICSMLKIASPYPGTNCVPEDSVKDTLQLIKRLHPILTKRAIAAECEGSKEPPFINSHDIVKMFLSSDMQETKLKENSHMAHLLIFKNPKWGISLVDIEDGNLSTQILDDMEKVFVSRLDKRLGLMIAEPNLPLQCLVRKQILTVVSALLIAAFGALTIIGSLKMVRAYIDYKKNSERAVFSIVGDIISILELHHSTYATSSPGGTQESYLAINHIRDNIILPKDRKKMAKLWDKAVKFLDENESRIRREVQLVAGEELQVWRWLGNGTTPQSPAPGSPKMSKVWQGSAFETMDGSVNSLNCSPTPCLKIRNMFDADVEFEDDWEVKVKDAILEKCGEGVKILHIKVDRGSREGCVYMKCMSQEDAGKAYKAVHGCWFDGHLVTVKYLRLERYHERFPESVNFKSPLKPSNNKRLSLQAHYFTDSSEAN
ncbi:uncharacterized protein LOC106656052 isoform X2 [Trichogramma pretiosum]|uniref:uncharacterized protein LOC106656052 isoform X2 n=1 Tax=Trichogramma pretiosum TaxID=7493 RepID=UPI0006C94620|nr:uncharacterized protein LOC106656052 isoform X2 [Trichogramma pretiosum]